MAKKETIRLYNGDVELTFEAARHVYRVTDPVKGLVQAKLPSVTAVLGVIAKPALISWAANMAAEHVADSLEPGIALDEVAIAELVREARGAWRRRRDKAADLGTIIHNWIEGWVKSQIDPQNNPRPELPSNPQVRTSVEQFLRWEQENHVRYLASELRLYSRYFGVVGTADLVLEIHPAGTRGPKYEVADFKTGEAIYPEYALQLAAYWRAIEESGYLRRIDGARVIRIGRDGTGFEAVRVISRGERHKHFKAFKAARELYAWKQEFDPPRRG